jgi:hypothetical protein
MRKAFGDSEDIGLLFCSIDEQKHPRLVKSNTKSNTLFKSQMMPSTSSSFTTLNNTYTGVSFGTNINLNNFYSLQKNLEIISCILSIACLLATTVVWTIKQSIMIQLTRNVQFRSQDKEYVNSMKLWHNTVAKSCASGSLELIMTQPPWKNANNQQYDGFSMEGVIHASDINLTAVAFFIYIFSASFQGKRFLNFKEDKITAGPEFSRWLEYALTSPLQIILVALSFGISNIDIILGFFGMQVALVLLGYNIEKQIKKIYLHPIDMDKTSTKFYNFKFFGDIRGPVYILVSWGLHFLIWGFPGLWEQPIIQWGIAGQYAYILQYDKKCPEKNFQMPFFVNLIFFGQFICFTLFGVVCTIQYSTAKYLGNEELNSKELIKGNDEYKQKWAQYSLFYAILSVSAKTLLEVGFLGLVVQSPEYLLQRPAANTNVLKINMTQACVHPNITNFTSANTMCYSI